MFKFIELFSKIIWLIIMFFAIIAVALYEYSIIKKIILIICVVIYIATQIYSWFFLKSLDTEFLMLNYYTLWRCDRPFLEIYVGKEDIKGKIEINNEVKNVIFSFVLNYVECYENEEKDENILFSGEIFLKKNICILKFDKEEKCIFEELDSVTLKKQRKLQKKYY